MSVCYWLVSKATKQCVHLAERSASYVAGPSNTNVLGLFCSVHEHSGAVLLADNDFDGGEFDKWTLENAAERYKAVTGENVNADVIQSLHE